MNGFDTTPNDPTAATPGPVSPSSADPFATSAAAHDPYTATGYSGPVYGTPAPGYVPPPSSAGLPNPGLATLLGFIPGVGAMYNGQFAKGLAHIVIFAILVSLSDHVNGIFGLLVAGWIFYMVFDSYQTARARRDGLQLPDPFGLNNIGERMGIGNGPNWSDFTAKPAPGQTPPPPSTGYGYAPGPQATPYQNAPDAAAPCYQQAYAPGSEPYAASGFGNYAAPYVPPIPPLPPLPGNTAGLPVGAFWLIGLGFFALLGTLSHRLFWSSRFLDGIIVLVVGATLLTTQTLRARAVYPAGSAAGGWYILRNMRGGLILLAIGVALTLSHLGIAWDYLWPYLLILLGVLLLVERALHNRMMAAGSFASGYSSEFPGTTDPFTPSPPTGTSFVPTPSPRDDEEGR